MSAYVRAIRGPIVLIVLGILMLIDHFGDVSFWRTWPALLIVFGAMVLAERAFNPPAQPPANYPTFPPADTGSTPGDIRL